MPAEAHLVTTGLCLVYGPLDLRHQSPNVMQARSSLRRFCSAALRLTFGPGGMSRVLSRLR
jgi:hypothetical protein